MLFVPLTHLVCVAEHLIKSAFFLLNSL